MRDSFIRAVCSFCLGVVEGRRVNFGLMSGGWKRNLVWKVINGLCVGYWGRDSLFLYFGLWFEYDFYRW